MPPYFEAGHDFFQSAVNLDVIVIVSLCYGCQTCRSK